MANEPPHNPDEKHPLEVLSETEPSHTKDEERPVDVSPEDDRVKQPVIHFVRSREEAFAEELERLRPRGIREARRFVHTQEEAEDATDTTIAHLFLAGVPQGAVVEAYFVTCVQNAAKSRVGSVAWRRSVDENVLFTRASLEESQLDELQRTQTIAAIRECLSLLDPEDCELIRLRYYESMTFKKMAHHYGEPLNTVRSRLLKAVDRLKTLLKKGGTFNV